MHTLTASRLLAGRRVSLATRRVGVGLAALALPVMLAGCGRGPHKVTLPLSATPPPCSAVTAATVNQILGTNVSEATGSAGTGSNSNVETCTYAGGSGVTLYYEVGATAHTLSRAQSAAGKTTAVRGLGAAAYSYQSSASDPKQYRAVALFGTLEVSVTADAPASAEESLLRTINAQL